MMFESKICNCTLCVVRQHCSNYYIIIIMTYYELLQFAAESDSASTLRYLFSVTTTAAQLTDLDCLLNVDDDDDDYGDYYNDYDDEL